MIKFKLYFDKDRETKWLDEMSEKGWAMTGFCAGFYTFEECEPGKWKYQVDFGEKFGVATEDYREFMTEAGIEIVQCWGYWIILRKRASEGPFELYTDVESSIAHYTKILKMFKAVTIIEILCLFVEIFAALGGTSIAWAFACIIAAFIFALINVSVKTKNTINELKKRQSGIDEGNDGRQVSAFLMVGLLVNSIALLTKDSVAFMQGTPKMVLQILAIVLMLIGIVQTTSRWAKER